MEDKTALIAVGLAAIVGVLFLSSQQPLPVVVPPDTVKKPDTVSDAVVRVEVERES